MTELKHISSWIVKLPFLFTNGLHTGSIVTQWYCLNKDYVRTFGYVRVHGICMVKQLQWPTVTPYK